MIGFKINITKVGILFLKKLISKMKELKDSFVRDPLFYIVLEYLNEKEFEPIFKRGLEKYDKITGKPLFKIKDLNITVFNELVDEAISYFKSNAEPMTEENIKKYLENE